MFEIDLSEQREQLDAVLRLLNSKRLGALRFSLPLSIQILEHADYFEITWLGKVEANVIGKPDVLSLILYKGGERTGKIVLRLGGKEFTW